MNKKTALLFQIIFFGASWGLMEATAGYFLHYLTTLTAGIVMFAFASFLLYRAYARTQSKSALLWIGLIAALIKGVDFLLPAHPVYGYVKVVNPMFCILAETLVLSVLTPVLTSDKPLLGIAGLLGASFAWRGAFLVYLIGQDAWFGTVSTQLHSWEAALTFVGIEGLISAALAVVGYGINHLVGKEPVWKAASRPIFALPMLGLAVILTALL